MKYLKHSIWPAAGAALLFATACGDDDEDDSSDDLIIGEWLVTESDGVDISSYNFQLNFQSGGDFEYCYDTDCYNGEWEYTDDTIVSARATYYETSLYSLDISFVLDIDSISEDRLEGDVTRSLVVSAGGQEYSYFEYTNEIVMEKQ